MTRRITSILLFFTLFLFRPSALSADPTVLRLVFSIEDSKWRKTVTKEYDGTSSLPADYLEYIASELSEIRGMDKGDDVSLYATGFFLDKDGNECFLPSTPRSVRIEYGLKGADACKYVLPDDKKTKDILPISCNIFKKTLGTAVFDRELDDISFEIVSGDKYSYPLEQPRALKWREGMLEGDTDEIFITRYRLDYGLGDNIPVYAVLSLEHSAKYRFSDHSSEIEMLYCRCGKINKRMLRLRYDRDTFRYGELIPWRNFYLDESGDIRTMYCMSYHHAANGQPLFQDSLLTPGVYPIRLRANFCILEVEQPKSLIEPDTIVNMHILPRELTLCEPFAIEPKEYDGAVSVGQIKVGAICADSVVRYDKVNLFYSVDSSEVRSDADLYNVYLDLSVDNCFYELAEEFKRIAIPFEVKKKEIPFSLSTTELFYGASIGIDESSDCVVHIANNEDCEADVSGHCVSLHNGRMYVSALGKQQITISVISSNDNYLEKRETFDINVSPKTLVFDGDLYISSRDFDGTSHFDENLLHIPHLIGVFGDDEVNVECSLDTSAVKSAPGTYDVIVSLRLSNANYQLDVDEFVLPFTITGDFVPIPSFEGVELQCRRPYNGYSIVSLPAMGISVGTEGVRVVRAYFDSPNVGKRSVMVDLRIDDGFEGLFANGQRQIEGILFSDDGEITKGEFSISLSAATLTYGASRIGSTPEANAQISVDPMTNGMILINGSDTELILPVGENQDVVVRYEPFDTENYSVAEKHFKVDVRPLPLSLVGGASVAGRQYDGTAMVFDSQITLPEVKGTIDGDVVSLVCANASYASANAGENDVSLTVLLDGEKASCYTIENDMSVLVVSSTISPLPISVGANLITVDSRPYNGKSVVESHLVHLSQPDGFISSDDVSLEVTFSGLDSTLPGERKATAEFVLTGADGSNYTLVGDTQIDVAVGISRRKVSLAGEVLVMGRVYDGTTNVDHSQIVLPQLYGVVDNDDIRLILASASLRSKNAGNAVADIECCLSGSDTLCYDASSVPLKFEIPVRIARRSIEVIPPIFSSLQKLYDGTADTPPMVSEPYLTDVALGDDVLLSYSAAFDSPLAGERQIEVTYSLVGPDAVNYMIENSYFLPATIVAPADEKVQLEIADLVVRGADCENDSVRISFRVVSGLPSYYAVDMGDGDGFIRHSLNVCYDGTAQIAFANAHRVGSVMFFVGDEQGNESKSFDAEWKSDVAIGVMQEKFDNVLFVNNHDADFSSYQWMKDGQPIEGATEQFYYDSAPLNGNYYAQIVTAEGEVVHSCEKEFKAESFPPQQKFAAYQSPAEAGGAFVVEYSRYSEVPRYYTLRVFTLDGRRVAEVVMPESGKVSLRLYRGIYFAEITDGAKHYTRKIEIR